MQTLALLAPSFPSALDNLAGEKPLEYEDMCGGVDDDDDDGDGGWDNDFVNGEDSCPLAGIGDVGTEEGPEALSAALHKKATQGDEERGCSGESAELANRA